MTIDNNSQEPCSICLEQINDTSNGNVLQRTTCNHKFCKNCMRQYIENWSQYNDLKCPICRRKLLLATRVLTI